YKWGSGSAGVGATVTCSFPSHGADTRRHWFPDTVAPNLSIAMLLAIAVVCFILTSCQAVRWDPFHEQQFVLCRPSPDDRGSRPGSAGARAPERRAGAGRPGGGVRGIALQPWRSVRCRTCARDPDSVGGAGRSSAARLPEGAGGAVRPRPWSPRPGGHGLPLR